MNEAPFWISIGDWRKAQYGQRADYKTMYSEYEVAKILKEPCEMGYHVYAPNGEIVADVRRSAMVLVFPPGPVAVSEWTFNALTECRDSAKCNMLDLPCVKRWLIGRGYLDTVAFIERCQLEYSEGVMRGFCILEES